jgi:hypothetical protein
MSWGSVVDTTRRFIAGIGVLGFGVILTFWMLLPAELQGPCVIAQAGTTAVALVREQEGSGQ